jgi:hypothetical protein
VTKLEPSAIFSLCKRYRYFLAWPTGRDNDRAALGVFANHKRPHALKRNQDGSPTHPLYLPAGLRPVPMFGAP